MPSMQKHNKTPHNSLGNKAGSDGRNQTDAKNSTTVSDVYGTDVG